MRSLAAEIVGDAGDAVGAGVDGDAPQDGGEGLQAEHAAEFGLAHEDEVGREPKKSLRIYPLRC